MLICIVVMSFVYGMMYKKSLQKTNFDPWKPVLRRHILVLYEWLFGPNQIILSSFAAIHIIFHYSCDVANIEPDYQVLFLTYRRWTLSKQQ